MKRLILTISFVAVLLAALSVLTDKDKIQVVSGENTVLVKLPPGILSEENYEHPVKEIGDKCLQKRLSKFGITTLRSVFRNRYNEQGRLKEEVTSSGKSLLSGWFELSLSSAFDTGEFITMLKQQNSVIDAVVDVPLSLKPDIAPNDVNYGSQWHLNNPANPNFDIDAEAAWDINRGRNDVIIAVLDGGVDYTHPDLDPGDRSRVIQGRDTGDGDNDPMDNLSGDGFAGHGTWVAGVIGARTNNGQQVAGVMWNCKIMPVKMVRSGGIRIPHILDWDWSTSAFPSDVADAIDYAVSHGAHVINLSYSFPDMGWPINDVALRVPLVYDAIKNAYQNNVVITASMGNEFNENNSVRYPAGFSEQVIAVGATNANGARSSFSNTGPHIDLSAPGSGIWTTERGGGVHNPSGTSFSAPMVAGVAGLVISQGKDRNFNLTNDDVRHILELTATDVADVGFDNETGHGIVNAHKALQLLDEPNGLYHYTSTGGTSVKVQTIDKWILASGRWGLAAGTYLSVDQYKVSKHITFDVPFCSTPKVWMRERESKSVSFSNPNNGRSFCSITNISNTGFDIEYAAYYVRYNTLGQTLNKWFPATPSATYVAYTAVGEPNLAATAGPITGPSIVCNSSGSTFTLNNAPANSSVIWTATPTPLIHPNTRNGTGTTAVISPADNMSMGTGTITYTITTDCGSFNISKAILVGGDEPQIERAPFVPVFGASGYRYRFFFGRRVPLLGSCGRDHPIGAGYRATVF
ncbi:MAG: S8 family serine peptidase [Breznakibacter sp.]